MIILVEGIESEWIMMFYIIDTKFSTSYDKYGGSDKAISILIGLSS